MDYEMHSDPSRDEVWQHIIERAESTVREVSHDEARNLFEKDCGTEVDDFELQILEGIDKAGDQRLFFGNADNYRVFLYCPSIDRGIWWEHRGGVTSRGLLGRAGREAARRVLENRGFL
jgi:hypothetical protein